MAVVPEETIYATHDVQNQVPVLENFNRFETDAALCEGVAREGGAWGLDSLRAFGEASGRAEMIRLGFLANEHTPKLHTHDHRGYRLDEVEYHPAYHELMRFAIGEGVHALPWNEPKPGAHVLRVAKHAMMTQVEAGIECPMTMTFAGVPAIRIQPELADTWVPRFTSTAYDPRCIPAEDKAGCLIGMAMTEKQGGSDVRANTTRAVALGAEGPGKAYHLTGHKWFCSAPMCDAFLVLAQTDRGLSCFFAPRWLPDGTKNRLYFQRLKNKLGNKSNASSEVEYRDTWAIMVGDEGRGVPTIIEMVNHTRLDCVSGTAGLMRIAVAHAAHHAQHRSAFGKRLCDQPLMQNVLADLALESEAATALVLRLARAYDEGADSEDARSFARIATAVGKYWVCKRGPHMAYEALECHGGNGFVEDLVMARVYREMPLASIWEGSGNVLCLDVLRAMAKEPETILALQTELAKAKGADARYDAHLAKVERELASLDDIQRRARRVVEGLAKALQAALLIQHAPGYVADAFCASRLDGDAGLEYGTLSLSAECAKIVERTTPAI